MLSFSAPPAESSNASAMRLAQDTAPITTPTTRTTRKRKSPPDSTPSDQQQPPPTPPQPQMHHVLPPMMPHPLPGPPPHGMPPPPHYYHTTDFTPGGMAPPQQLQGDQGDPSTASGRALSNSKRAEQNRKAQRAFRERRDQHVKALESRSQLLDAALASADEANRRWEECRALVDQLRVENAALRAALQQSQLLPPGAAQQPPPQLQLQHPGHPQNGSVEGQQQQQHNHGAQLEEATRSLEAVVNELKPDSPDGQGKTD